MTTIHPTTVELDSPERLLRELEMLRYSLSHDLRTPAMTILGFAELLTDQLSAAAKNDSAGQYLQHIRSSAQRQLTVIEKLLEYEQVSRQAMHIETVDLQALWHQQWLAIPVEHRQNVAFTVDALPSVQGDRTLLTLLLRTLLDNAVKFTRHTRPARIHVGVSSEDGVIWHSITDTGVGFPAERSDYLFRPFQKLHANKQYEGIGMGLCVAARIAERHLGKLEGTGQPNAGATFRFCINC